MAGLLADPLLRAHDRHQRGAGQRLRPQRCDRAHRARQHPRLRHPRLLPPRRRHWQGQDFQFCAGILVHAERPQEDDR
eukprot:1836854-Rhodomonas_salina.1